MKSANIRASAVAGFTLVAMYGFVTPRVAQAQTSDRPMAFVHGLNSDSTSWAKAANRLAREFPIKPYSRSTSWKEHFAQQSVELNGKLSVEPRSFITLGHSNGGLVSRLWNKETGRNTEIITVGTLHYGAPLALKEHETELSSSSRIS